MKRLLSILFLIVFSVGVFAQERTLDTHVMQKTSTYYKYTGVAADTLIYETQDTIDVPVFLNKDYPVQFYANFNVDTIQDNDMKLEVKVLGKVFADESWTAITDDESAAVSTNGFDFAISQIGNPSLSIAIPSYTDSLNILAAEDVINADSTYTIAERIASFTTEARTLTATQTYSGQYYRYLLFRLILTNTSTADDGLTLNNMELKIWERKY